MLSYKEYKKLNESLYGSFNLGIKNPNVVAGVVSSSQISGTEIAEEEALEEAKKKCDDEKENKDAKDEDEKENKDVKDEDEKENKDVKDEDEKENKDAKDEDKKENKDAKDEEEGLTDAQKKLPEGLKKAILAKKNKESKKEHEELISDLDSIIESISDNKDLIDIKIELESIKESIKKKSNNHKADCECKMCKKLYPENMTKEDVAWWNSVNGMLNTNPEQKNWDGGWSAVGEIKQAVRES